MLAVFLAMALSADHGSRDFAVTSFHAVDLATKATVRIEQAPTTKVVATGDPRLVRCVTADVRDGRLVIGRSRDRGPGARSRATADAIIVNGRPDCQHQGNQQRLSIRVTAPAIDSVTISEQGVVLVAAMSVPVFAANIPGRGSIAIGGLRAGRTSFSIPGIGHIAATGDLGRLSMDVPGSGVIDARAAHARVIDVAIGGHGDIAATVDGPVSGTFAGAGRIVIAGHPACAIRKLGSGRITCPAE